MNKKKRNVDSGRKSARPDYIQKTISQKSSGKRSGKVFFPQTLIKTGGIIIFVLLLGFAGNKFFLSVSKTDSGKVKGVSASGADEEKEGWIIGKTKETKDVVEMKKTKYDLNSGTLSIDPGRTVKWRYYGTRSSTESFWLGMEDSAAIYKGYIFMTDNGGNLMCLDLNTLQLVWVQDTLDDSNSTPVLEIEKGHLYLYVSTSFRLGWRSYDTATVPVWKIDAETGEIVWHTDYECTTDDGVSGGVQSTIACGKNSLADYIYVTVAKTSDNASGVLACLRKSDGSKAWEDSSSYAWSSPVCVYNKDGSGKVLYCNSTGDIRLLDGKTGKQEDVLSVSEGVIEASPAVYDNYAVVGTRDCKIWGIRLQ